MSRRPGRRRSLALGWLLVVLATGACRTADDPPTDAAAVAAAARICPVMWAWVTDVGATFNQAASDVADIDDPAGRRRRWEAALTDIEALNRGLADDLAEHRDDEILGPLVAEVERDLPRAADVLEDTRRLLVDHPEIDEGRHQVRTSQLIVRIEKVIDLPKPDLAALDPDGVLIPAFRRVPSCQQSIRDVDDGNTRANG